MEARERTLVVTHDPGLAGQVRGAVQVLGGCVITAGNAERALEQARTFGVELVVAAIQLPGTDGYDLCRKLKEWREETRVVLVHPHGDQTAARRCAEAGADATLTRPLRGVELAECLEKLVGRQFFTGVDATDDALNWPHAADSIVDPKTGVFPATEGDVVVSEDEGWAESVVSAAIESLDEAAIDVASDRFAGVDPDVTQDLPEVAVEQFDEANPVSVPVDAGTTAHFKPVQADPSSPSESGAFLPAEATPTSSSRIRAPDTQDVVKAEIDKLTAPGGPLAKLIEESVSNAITEALKAVLPAVTAEAARLAREPEDG